MPRNGAGTFSLVAGNPVVTGTVISSTVQNNTATDFATGLTQSLAYDGQTAPIANLPMATYRHTGVGNAVARTDYAAAGQVQDGALIWCGTAGGTKNALTLTPSPAITAYAAGQRFYFKSGAAASDSTVTVAISGLATIAVQVNGSALVSGEIAASEWYEILLSSTSVCQLSKVGIPTLTELGISSFAQTILDDANAAAVIATIGAFANAGMATWTPTISGSIGGVGVYSTQVGRYLAIGNLIIATAYVGFDINTLNGSLSISLPVTSENVTNSYVMGLCTYWGGFATSMTRIGGFAPPNSSTFALHKMTAAAASSSTALLNTDCDASQEFMFVFAYFKP